METDTTFNEGPMQGPPPPQPPPPPIRRLQRGPGGPVGGVATGIGYYFGIDPVIVQIAFVVLTVFGGSGILLYLAGWLLIPAYGSGPNDRSGFWAIVVGAIGLIAGIGALVALVGTGTLGFEGSFIFPLLLIGGGFYLLSQRPGEAAAVGDSIRNLFRPREPDPEAPYSPPEPAGTSWATPRVDNSQFSAAGATPPPAPTYVQPPRREPGPPITAVSLALSAVVVGLLIWLDYATSLTITATTVFGAVLAICGAGLVFSAFKGRAWGLVPVAFIAAFGLLLAPIDISIDSTNVGEFNYTITSPSMLESRYEVGAGELTLDLTALELTEDTSVELDLGAGSIRILLPEDMAVDVTAKARLGDVSVFDLTRDGVDPRLTDEYRPVDADPGDPVLTIDATTRLGEVEIRHDK